MGSIRVQETRSEWSGRTVRVVRRHGPSGPGPSGPQFEKTSPIHLTQIPVPSMRIEEVEDEKLSMPETSTCINRQT